MLAPQICTDRGTHTRVHALTPNFTSTHVSGLNSNFVCFICFTSFRLISFRFRFFSSFYPLWRRFYSISTQSSDNSSISVSIWVCVCECADMCDFLSTAFCCQAGADMYLCLLFTLRCHRSARLPRIWLRLQFGPAGWQTFWKFLHNWFK